MTTPEHAGSGRAKGSHRSSAHGDVTVLMAVWKGDRPELLAQALRSAGPEQTLPPREILVMVDGPLTAELDAVLDQASRQAQDHGEVPVRIIRCAEHRGLADTLADGVRQARTELIARADADDINAPDRLARQVPFLIDNDVDILGSAMREIGADGSPVAGAPVRTRPIDQAEIRRYARTHNPFQHPTVLMRRRVVLNAGNYHRMPYLEDWWLWIRMLMIGARAANLNEPLVSYRVDAGLYARRGGLELVKSDIRLHRLLVTTGFTPWPLALRNLAVRIAYRVVPNRLRSRMHRLLVNRV
ncbi:glycosyltransferase [Devriesea agamarum]|uniref:glycosyltransferase n=1 Tax=Devriesea agamarum TaxID=472569 RepID=UPI00071D3DDA|nr:glycosyltransferase [Devriesea agamarum]